MWQIDTNSKYWWNLFDLDSTTNEGRSAGKKYQKIPKALVDLIKESGNLRNLRILESSEPMEISPIAPRNGRWTEPAEAEDVEAEAEELQEDGQMGR